MSYQPKNLEQKLEELEGIVHLLEESELNLNDNIKNFEKGIKLYKECKTILNKAEKKVQELADSLKEEEL